MSDLWKENTREWNQDIFEGVLNPEDQQLASSLYISKHAQRDDYDWAYSKNAHYSVRSGYWVATHVDCDAESDIPPPTGSIVLKKDIWLLKIAPKLRHFLWRCLSGAIATTVQLRKRSIPADTTCQRCCNADETINHILFSCPYAQAVWKCGIGHIPQPGFSEDLEDNLGMFLQLVKNKLLSPHQRLLPFWIMWRLWKSRNEFIFNKVTRTFEIEARNARRDTSEWLAVNTPTEDEGSHHYSTHNRHSPQDRNFQWTPPPNGWLKCNFDSGFVKDRHFTNTGWVLRDSQGHTILTGCAQLQSSISALQAEAFGFLHVLQACWSQGFRQIWFESDNQELVKIINAGEDHVLLRALLQDIRFWMSKLPLSSIEFVNRERNSAADKMANHAATINSMYEVYSVPPPWLVNFLYFPYTI